MSNDLFESSFVVDTDYDQCNIHTGTKDYVGSAASVAVGEEVSVSIYYSFCKSYYSTNLTLDNLHKGNI